MSYASTAALRREGVTRGCADGGGCGPAASGPGELFHDWLERVGGAYSVGQELKDLDEFPLPDERPDFYIDYDETGPYEAEVGAGECAGS